MNQHPDRIETARTTGRATVTGYHPHIMAGGRIIADCWPISSQTGRANAARLVRCWNALEPLTDAEVDALAERIHNPPADRIAAAWREEFAAHGFQIETADFSRLALWAVHELGNEDDGAGFGHDLEDAREGARRAAVEHIAHRAQHDAQGDSGRGFGLDSYARAAFVELFGREPDSEEDTQILEDVSEEIT